MAGSLSVDDFMLNQTEPKAAPVEPPARCMIFVTPSAATLSGKPRICRWHRQDSDRRKRNAPARNDGCAGTHVGAPLRQIGRAGPSCSLTRSKGRRARRHRTRRPRGGCGRSASGSARSRGEALKLPHDPANKALSRVADGSTCALWGAGSVLAAGVVGRTSRQQLPRHEDLGIMSQRTCSVFGSLLLATLLAAPSAHAVCRSPKSICKHIDDCLQRTSDPANKDAERIRDGVRTRNGQIVWAGAEACARDLGRKSQWDAWAREASYLENVSMSRRVLNM